MRISKLMTWGSTFVFLFVGALFLSINPANAVADLRVNVTDGTQALGGSTIRLTAPDGTVTERTDQDGDGRIAVVLGDSGTYRMTITTPDGSSRSTTFNAPRNGSVTVDYDRSAAAPPRVSVNDTTSPSRTARNGDNGGPFSFSLLGSYGMSKWDTRLFDGVNNIDGPREDIKKWGIGPAVRYDMPNIPLFIAGQFFYHAKGRFNQPANVSSYLFEARERWRMNFLLGWYIFNNNGVLFSAMAGLTLAKIHLQVQGNFNLFEGSEVQVAPTVGAQVEVPINMPNFRQLYWTLGFTLAFMNAFEIDDQSLGEQFRIDSDLQWDLISGIRVPF